MSRVAKNPILIPKGVEVKINGQQVSIKGPKGELTHQVHELIGVEKQDDTLRIVAKEATRMSRSQISKRDMVDALSGTTRALLNNVVVGVTTGFVKKLLLVGVGYRAQAQGSKINLSLGFSHPVEYALPAGVTAKTATQTEIEIEGADRQKVGQVAAEIRAIRPPEPYKGKGVRYAGEKIILKETKKK